MKQEAQLAIKAIEEKLSNSMSLEREDLIKLLTLKLISTKNEE